MVTHIYTETEKIFKGTDHENDWYFYHDALSMMTSAPTIAWMKEKGYYDRWLLPKLDLLAGTIYRFSLPGDSPELMPLDNSLNKDVDDSALRHIGVTMDLSKDDLKKFSLATPNEGALIVRYYYVDACFGIFVASATSYYYFYFQFRTSSCNIYVCFLTW